jgi:hypothetical protein
MAITFQKRQKEMKRMEKQRAKAERRAQKKQAKRDSPESVPGEEFGEAHKIISEDDNSTDPS